MSRVTTNDLGSIRDRRSLEEEYARAEQIRGRQPNASMSQRWDDPRTRKKGGKACGHRQNVGRTERLVSLGAGAALVACGLARGRLGGLLLSALGGGLAYRGYTGHCQCYEALGINRAKHNEATAVPAKQGYKVEKSITINRSPEELYSFWRELENLPRVMQHLKEVEPTDRQRSHWVAEGALGRDVEWDAEIYNERENELIAWRSLPGGDIDTAGSVRFKPLGHNRGTEVTVSIKYNPPGGKIGASIASLLGEGLESKIVEDLRNLKRLIETGEIATTAGQPNGLR